MDRKKVFEKHKNKELFNNLKNVYKTLDDEFLNQFNRSLPFSDELIDRWERAEKLNFGENSSIYDSSYVFGKPKVGKDVWIGPFTIIDGSGELHIGNNVTVSTGVHIYTHDNIKQTLIGKTVKIERGKVSIGNNTYIGPNTIISKDVKIGNRCIIGANSLVNKDFADNAIIVGTPAKQIGEVIIKNSELKFKYYK